MGSRILIVDDVATNRIILKVKLAAAWYQVLQASDGPEAIQTARFELPDLILLDMAMPGMDGLEVCAALKSMPETTHIPIIMISAHRGPDLKLKALRAGADEFMTKPLDELALMARVRSLLRAHDIASELRLRDSTSRALGFAEPVTTPLNSTPSVPPGRITLVGNKVNCLIKWKLKLKEELADDITILSRDKVLADPDNSHAADVFVIVSDIHSKGDGLLLMSELRSRARTRHAAIVMIVAPDAHNVAAMALDLGASDILVLPVDIDEMAVRLRTQMKRKRQSDILRRQVRDGLKMAVTDPLTGLYNRRYALSHLSSVLERADETKRSFAVMLLDLDLFKSVNDRFGHLAGDTVLREVGEQLRINLRNVDLVARVGGEEFMIVMPDTDPAKARIAAQRLCRKIEEKPIFAPSANADITQTVSIGVVVSTANDHSAENTCQPIEERINALLDRADRALYRAKSAGRNGVIFSKSAA
ncbi:MAG: two-component system cell cycle response regulator [Paracoccaceae bacterium]|jgi:two-component system cell cycle response regulator